MELTRLRRQQHRSALHYVDRVTACRSMHTAVRMISEQFAVPMVQVNVLTADEQLTVAAVGCPLGARPRAGTLCTHVVHDGRAKFLSDIHPLPPRAAHIKAYLGVPLVGREGLVIGVLCVLDTAARTFTAADLRNLQSLAAMVQDQLELMRGSGGAEGRLPTEPTAASELAAAVRNGSIEPFYQPIVDLRTGRIAGVEALARWRHPTRGLLAPDAFLPQAEQSDIIFDLDLSVLQQSATQLARWRTRHPQLRLSVNLSGRHFDRADRRRNLRDALGVVDLDPSTMTLELTETAALAPDPDNQQLLQDLRGQGFGLVLDDFGSGFASMEQVLRLPVDGIKLDRAFAAALGTRSGDAVMNHLLALAADLELSTVVEGIEDARHRDQVSSAGADYGQGYLWAPALSAADLTTLLSARN